MTPAELPADPAWAPDANFDAALPCALGERPPTAIQRSSFVRQFAVVGGLQGGKTTLLDALCAGGQHPVSIGSALRANRGVVSLGPAGASATLQGACATCAGSVVEESPAPCAPDEDCPGIGPRRGWALLRWLGATTAPRPEPRQAKPPNVLHLYDSHGTASLAATGGAGQARDLVLSGQLDGVLLVADAAKLERALVLLLELAEFGLPAVLDVNKVDLAETLGIEVDDGELTRSLGIPVNRSTAVERRGVRRVGELLLDARVPRPRAAYPEPVAGALGRLETVLAGAPASPRGVGLLLLAGDAATEAWVAERLGPATAASAAAVVADAQARSALPLRQLIANALQAEARRLTERAVETRPQGPSALQRFGWLAQQPLQGSLIAAGVLLFAYYWVGAFGATYLVDTINVNLFENLLIPLCQDLVAFVPTAFLRDAIMDPQFGVLPTGLFLAVGLVLPVLFCFYFLQALLEDSGYLPRLAVLLDRLSRKIGLSGQSVIPMVLGFSCVTMAVIATRLLHSRKERVVLTFLLVLAVPCAPLLAVMFVVLGKLSWTATAVYFGFLALQVVVAGNLAARLLPGGSADLILEIPPMRIPKLRVLARKTWRSTVEFMREAVPIFLAAAFAVFCIDRVGGLALIETIARPVTHGLLGLPDDAAQVFIKTAIRRESGAAELNLLRDQFTGAQLVVTMLVMTLVVPCINTLIVLFKEYGARVALPVLGLVIAWAVAAGAVLNLFCALFGLTFAA